MLDKQTIRRECRSVTYQKALQIYQLGEVEDCQVSTRIDEFGDEIAEIEAWVEGSSYNSYEVFLTVNESTSTILYASCECPAFEQYDGLCKHCAAVLFVYLDMQKEVWKNEDSLESWMEQMGVRKGRSVFRRKRDTSAYLQAMLRQRSLEPAAQAGEVHLDVSLQYSYYSGMAAKWKVGTSHMYIIKDLEAFGQHLWEGSEHSYGKKLQFVHRMEAFDEESRPLAEFLCRQIRLREGMYRTPYRKELPVKRSLADELMELLKDREISMEWQNYPGRPAKQAVFRMTEEIPFPLFFFHEVEDGVELQVKAPEFSMEGNRFFYFFYEKEAVCCRLPQAKYMDLWELLQQKELFVSSKDLPVFSRMLLPELTRQAPVELGTFDPVVYQPALVTFALYLDAPQRDMISCRALAVYENARYHIFGQEEEKEEGAVIRDEIRERQVRRCLEQWFCAYDEGLDAMVLQGTDAVYQFLTEGITQAETLGEVYISDTLKGMRQIRKVRPQFGVSIRMNLVQLRISDEQFSKEELAEILSRYERKKKYYQLKNGMFVQMDAQTREAVEELKDTLQLTDKQLGAGEVELPGYRALFLEKQLEQQGMPLKEEAEFAELIRNMDTAAENVCQIPEALEAILKPYQKQGFFWMKTLHRNHFGGILADDMGLGKTLQTIAFLLSEFQEKSEDGHRLALIVTPASLVYNWQNEFARFAPELPVRMVTGTARERKLLLEDPGADAILLTSYQLLNRDQELYKSLRFDYQVIDEAQFIKNQGNQTTRAVKQIQAGFRLALTGTPVENRLSELWSIFDYILPGFLYRYQRFRKEIEIPVTEQKDAKKMARLQGMIRPFVLRRGKREVLKELPDKLEQNLYTRLTGEQRDLYEGYAERLRLMLSQQSEAEFDTSKIRVLAELTRLRQICCDPGLFLEGYQKGSAKLNLCMDLVENAVEAGHKILLFSQFTTMLERITGELKKRKIGYYLLTGGTPKKERVEMAQAFNGDETPVFCISLKAGGTGLNLTGADLVIHYDPWWNQAVEAQAEDRAHRIGQEQVVTVYRLIARGTIEERILELQEKKRELADQILGGEEMGSPTFGREELLALLENKE